MAAQGGHVQVIEELKKAGADVRAENGDGQTPREIAEANGHAAAATALDDEEKAGSGDQEEEKGVEGEKIVEAVDSSTPEAGSPLTSEGYQAQMQALQEAMTAEIEKARLGGRLAELPQIMAEFGARKKDLTARFRSQK